MYTTSPSLRRARSAGPTGVPSSTSPIRTSSSRITVTGAVSPVRLGEWPATGTTRLRSACPFSLHRASPSPVRLGGWPATGTTRLRSACPFSLHRASPSPVQLGGWPATGTTRLRSACPFSLHRASPSPVRLGGWPAIGTTRLRSACPFSLRRPASAPLPPSRPVSFHPLTAVAVGEPQAHARVLRAAEAEPDDRRLAREAALAELHQRVDEEPLDAGDPVRREEHAVVGAEEPALVDRGDVDPVSPRLERVRDLGRVDADVVVVVPPC